MFEAGRIEAGKAPVLAGGVERIRRRADAEMAGDRDLLVPGVEPVGLHADGDVEIEPDLHAEPVREILAATAAAGRRSIARIRRTRPRPRRGPWRKLRAGGLVGLPPLLPAIPTTAS